MIMRRWIILGCGAMLIGGSALVVQMTRVATAPFDTKETPSVDSDFTCSDRNLSYMAKAFQDVLGLDLATDKITQSWCAKSAFNSDLFAVVALDAGLALPAERFVRPNDWEAERIAAAGASFNGVLPVNATPQAFSGFNADGTWKVVVMDYGDAGRFAYFEL